MAALIPTASASGSGTMTLSGPSTNSNQTITIPDATGTMMVSGNMPAFSAYESSAQTLSTNTWTKITCQTKEWDTASSYDNTTNYRFTPQVAGYYQVIGQVAVAGTTTGIWLALYKNGSTFKYGTQVSSISNGSLNCAWQVYLNGSTDYIELYCRLTIGQALSAASTDTYFQSALIRAA